MGLVERRVHLDGVRIESRNRTHERQDHFQVSVLGVSAKAFDYLTFKLGVMVLGRFFSKVFC